MKCPKCGYENEAGAPFCNMCYEVLNKAARPVTPSTVPAPASQAAPLEAPEKAGDSETLKKIKEGWVAAAICGCFTFFAVIVASMVPALAAVVSAWALVDAVLILILAYGIHAKSRTAATLMFLYYLAAKIHLFATTGKPAGLFITGLFLYYFFRAMTATFDYHKERSA